MGCGGSDSAPADPADPAAMTDDASMAAADTSQPAADTSADTSSSDSSSSSSSSNDIGSNDPNTLAAIGDSITAGSEISGPSYPSRLSGILGKKVVNLGSPGATSSKASGAAGSALGRKPSYLLLRFGTHDVFREVPSSTVAGNVGAAVKKAKANRTIPVVGTIPPFRRSEFQNGLVASINSRLKAMASSEGARVARVNAEFGSGAGLIQEDGYHPNDTGTQVIAFAFADAIR
jgi:lysophospholipase L1-like esterase